MDPHLIKAIVVCGAAFGIFGAVPIVMALLRHQQEMAKLFAKGNVDSENLAHRLESLERRLNALERSPTSLAGSEGLEPRTRSLDRTGV
jgi:hypothetical protein